jgi:NodT family efflux transporter outer membrane factor (OMF) lipoprotein
MGFARPRWEFLLLAGVLSFNVGCTSFKEYVGQGFKVGHDYLRPAAPVAEDWIDKDDRRIDRSETDLNAWWKVLNDPTLDALVINATQQNLTLREAGFRVMQARAARAIAGGNLFPQQQSAFGDYTRRGVSKANANTSFLPKRFYDQFDVGLNLAWEIDFWGRFRRAIEAADADLDASVEGYDQVLVTLLSDIASTYTEIRTLQRRIALAQQNVVIQRETFNIADARFRGGLVGELDVDQAASTLAQTQALIPQLELQLRQSTNRLCVLLGEPPSNIIAILAQGKIPTAPTSVAVGIPADLLRRRPDVRRAERAVAAQSARVGVATTELYPHISVTGTIAYSAEKAGDLFTPRALNGSVGPSFQWNILNYGRLLNNIRLQDARLAELIVTYQNQVLVANAEVENGMAEFIRSRERADLLAQSVHAAEKAVRVALAEYRGGSIDFNRVALVEQNLVQQQDLLSSAQGDIVLGLIEVYRALGGGWEIRLEQLPGTITIPPGTPAPALKLPIEMQPLPPIDDAAPAAVPNREGLDPAPLQPAPPAEEIPAGKEAEGSLQLRMPENVARRLMPAIPEQGHELPALPRQKD